MSWNTNGNSIASHSILQQQSVGQELKNLLDAAFKLNDVTANSNKTKFAIILKNLRIEIERQLGVITMQWSHFDIDSKDVATLHEWNVRPHQRAKTIGFISCEARLNSFADWPEVAAVKPEGLADAGFFYVGTDDNVKCFYCDGELSQWEPNDDPWIKHSRVFPHCGFILLHKGYPFTQSCGQQFGEGKIGVQQLLDLKNCDDDIIKRAFDRRRLENIGPFENLRELHDAITEERTRLVSYEKYFIKWDANDIGSNVYSGPRSTSRSALENFSHIASRFNSFCKWPQTARIKPQRLADAGFVYIGIGDCVKCYYCDGMLCHWHSCNDPWVEHSRWFPDCGFVLCNKGCAFVESCQQKFGEGISSTIKLDDDLLALKATTEWLKCDIVKQLFKNRKYPIDIIKATLHQRWVEKQVPFENPGELNDAVLKYLMEKSSRLICYGRLDANNLRNCDSSLSPENVLPMESFEPSPQTSLQSNRECDERLICKVCLHREVSAVFLPCGHTITCTQCAPGINNCPICKKVINGLVRAFL